MTPLTVLLVVVVAALIATGTWCLYRVALAMRAMKRQVDFLADHAIPELFWQLQALNSLERLLALSDGLPPVRGWAASPDFLLMVARHARRCVPATIVECGSGVSTIVLARCAEQNGGGHVYSLEHDSRYAEQTRTRLKEYGLGQWVTIIDAPLSPVMIAGVEWRWYAGADAIPDKIDLLVVDGPPGDTGPVARYPAGPILFGRMNAGAAVFVDDAGRSREQEAVRRWLAEYPGLRSLQHRSEKGCVEISGF